MREITKFGILPSGGLKWERVALFNKIPKFGILLSGELRWERVSHIEENN